MPAPRPADIPHFADSVPGGYPGRIMPNSGKLDSGYDNGEAPPAGEHNWLFGILSDWIAYLDDERAVAARTDTANVFVAAPQTVNVGDATLPALQSTQTAAADPEPTNIWKASLAFAIADGGGYARMYTGRQGSGVGEFIVCINAIWDPSNQEWSKDNDALESFALILQASTGLYLSRRPAGAGTWTAWGAAGGDLVVPGDCIVGGDTNITGNVAAADATFSGTAEAADAAVHGNITVDAGSEVVYDTPVARSVALRLGSGKGIKPDAVTNEYSPTNPGVDIIMVPLPPVPAGASLTGVDCSAHQNTTSPNSFKLWKRHVNYSSPAAPTFTQVGSTATHAASAGYPATVSIDPGGLTVINVADEYYVEWLPADAGDKLVGIRVNFNDPGPRNY